MYRQIADAIEEKGLCQIQVAMQIVADWQSQDPVGRFLKLDKQTMLWDDVGDKKVFKETTQALQHHARESNFQFCLGTAHGHVSSKGISSSALLELCAAQTQG